MIRKGFVLSEKSLYDRIGGREAIQSVVSKMYQKIIADKTLAPFFKDTDLTTLRKSQTAFLVMAFDGPHKYTGQSLRDAHKKYVEEGLSDVHFDAVAGHLLSVLQELRVDQVMIDEVMKTVSSTRNDVLCR